MRSNVRGEQSLRDAGPEGEISMVKNAFEAVCRRASREQWYLGLDCGPCCTGTFRAAFDAIVSGLHPDEPQWPSHPDGLNRWECQLALPYEYDRVSAGVLMGVVGSADLVALSKRVPENVWLGALEVVLECVGQVEKRVDCAERWSVAILESGLPHCMKPMGFCGLPTASAVSRCL
jgi:hypothetical protein